MSLFKEKLLCPVCKASLGDRFKHELYISHCDECKAVFIWKAGVKKPESHVDSEKKEGCGCGGCGR